ncbi:unnamed protein product [Pieris macdunnoughi]|uniref:Ig-like domain-containing protein n=1 Tax=Pieris macdunnoughi TaxID=345717 RepID=A0A821S0H0_9NEOP|nr:unnamed protein product [Pieris macdunnoughi]
MCGKCVSLCLLFLLKQEFAVSIRITELTVPSHAVESGSVLLQCQYDLEGEMLYSLNWYKDGIEFYKYVPSNNVQYNFFPQIGVNVDEKDSSSNVIKLTNLTSDSAGLYRCELSGEGPYFITVHDERNISVHLLPYRRPQVTGLEEEYRAGDIIAVNCSSSRSRPQARLKWLINNEAAPRKYVTGPWYRISRERPDARETILQLRFIVKKEHFENGILQLKCQATIAPLYQDEVIHHIIRAEDNRIDPISEDVMNEEINRLFDQHTQLSSYDDIEMTVAESQNGQGIGAIMRISGLSVMMMVVLQILL